MFDVEGIRVRAEHIPREQLVKSWRKLTNQPFPRIRALRLKDEDFERVMRLRRCKEDELRELEEWNTILTEEGTDACVYNAQNETEDDFTILIREHPYHPIEKIIEHELLHIVKGDL